ncbi:hypothetical protein Xsto_04114 [Xenorhabdus stockiae]|uniref:Uncharacterized protein n=1 Tax=Xenorhabdus stockiae TaxID=351614 RepID=A0A2D0K562_9GAMM|nr:hypothetical protein [Xenorhabdus stockiae]PHM58551.1 hypothetical protein Xsto_04114 [Xenorhabdus stockiae]
MNNLSELIKRHENTVELFCEFADIQWEGDSAERLVKLMTANLTASTEELKAHLLNFDRQ